MDEGTHFDENFNAEHFAYENDLLCSILRNFQNEEAASPRVMSMLYNILLGSIGLTHNNITEDQVKVAFMNFKWTSDLDRFQFMIDQQRFEKLASFLWDLFDGIKEEYEAMQKNTYYYTYESITRIFYILYNWCTLTDIIQHMDPRYKWTGLGIDSRFSEAFARINVELLKHAHMLRVEFHNNVPFANVVCRRLYDRIRIGIFSPRSHCVIVSALVDVFATELELFMNTDYTILDFFYSALVAETEFPQHFNRTIRMFYNLLVQNTDGDEEQRSMDELVEFLLSDNMMQAYKKVLDKPLAVLPGTHVVLNYFHHLISKSKMEHRLDNQFLNTLTFVITKIADDTDRDMAVAAFVGIYQELDRGVSKMLYQIIEFSKIYNFQFTFFKPFIKSFFHNTPPIKMIDELMFFIEKCNDEIERLIASYIIIIIFELMLEQIDVYQCYIELFLEKFDVLLEKIKSPTAYERLLTLFENLNFDILQEKLRNFDVIVEKFEQYSIDKFMTSYHLGTPVLAKLIKQYLRCMHDVDQFEEIFQCGIEVMQEFMKTDSAFKRAEMHQAKTPDKMVKKLMRQYCVLVEKLKILFDLKAHKTLHIKEYCRSVADRIFVKDNLKDLVLYGDNEIAFMGLEALKNALVAISKCSPQDQEVIFEILPKLKDCCSAFLRRAYHFTFANALLVKTVFTTFIDLHVVFSEKNTIFSLKVTESEYLLLMNVLQQSLFEYTGFSPPRLVEYLHTNFYDNWLEWQHTMLASFNQLHQCQIMLPVHLIWKICIYYGTTYNNEFNSMLEELCQILLVHYQRIYRGVVAKLVLNLYKRELDQDVIEHTIRQHRRLIDENVTNEEQKYTTKMEIIHLVLTMTAKIHKLMSKNKQVNRCESLMHLHLFAEGSVMDLKTLKEFLKVGSELEEYDLTDDERDTVEKFLDEFRKFI